MIIYPITVIQSIDDDVGSSRENPHDPTSTNGRNWGCGPGIQHSFGQQALIIMVSPFSDLCWAVRMKTMKLVMVWEGYNSYVLI